jgi:hypothetical protein
MGQSIDEALLTFSYSLLKLVPLILNMTIPVPLLFYVFYLDKTWHLLKMALA